MVEFLLFHTVPGRFAPVLHTHQRSCSHGIIRRPIPARARPLQRENLRRGLQPLAQGHRPGPARGVDRLFKGKLRVQDEHRQGEVHRHPPDRLRGGPRL